MDDQAGEVTRLLQRIEAGEDGASDCLLELVYGQLRAIARGYMARERAGHTLQPTALVHEAFIRLFGSDQPPPLTDRAHFFSAAASAMRRVLVDHARRRNADKGPGKKPHVPLDDALATVKAASKVEILELNDALDEFELKDRLAFKIVMLRFFGGLEMEQIANLLGVALRTVERDWAAARAWLAGRLRGSR